MNKMQTAWETLFKELSIAQEVRTNGFFDLSATTIRKLTGEEPRLMAKWDNKASLPQVFSDNNLNIFPLSTSEYRIANFNIFHDIEQNWPMGSRVCHFQIPSYLRTLAGGMLERSESILISACYGAGVFEDFRESDPHRFLPTVHGRLRTNKMTFTIGTANGGANDVRLNGAQFEIDGGFESEQEVLLVEAKNYHCVDFNIRQIYLPWLYFSRYIVPRKTVVPVFLMRSNSIVSLFQYKFNQRDRLDSIELVKSKRYSLLPLEFTVEHIRKILADVRQMPAARPSQNPIPFPQANVMDLVINLCEFLQQDKANYEELADFMEYDERQGSYYGAAACFLRLAVKAKPDNKYVLSTHGRKIFTSDMNVRVMEIAKAILRYSVFQKTVEHTLQNNMRLPNTDTIAKWLIDEGWPMNPTTAKRRASTVSSWCRWIIDQRTDA